MSLLHNAIIGHFCASLFFLVKMGSILGFVIKQSLFQIYLLNVSPFKSVLYTLKFLTFTGNENVLHLLYYNKIHNLDAWLWVINWYTSCKDFSWKSQTMCLWFLPPLVISIHFLSILAVSGSGFVVKWIRSLSLLHFPPSP